MIAVGALPRPLVVAVAITLAVQAVTSMAMVAPSVLAPAVAPLLGAAPQRIGLFVSVAYFAAMLSGLACGGLIAGLGALRVCQLAVLLAAAGLVLGAAGWLPAMPLAALVIGVGYGFVNPASSHILSRATPSGMMALVFSIKQTGVPIGGMIAGALVPALLLGVGWQATVVLLALATAAVALGVEPARRTGEAPAPDETVVATRLPAGVALRRAVLGLGGPIRLVLAERRMRELAAVSFSYATVQLGLFTYLVSFLNLEVGYTLVAAGLVFAFAQAAGVVGRVVWGALADRVLGARAMLGLLGVTMAACGLATAFESASWPLAAVAALSAVFGASAVGWNGVYLAEVARRAPPGAVGAATGGTQFFTFLGALAGPPLFGSIAAATGRYSSGYAAFSMLPLAVGVWLLATRRDGPPSTDAPDDA
ncbi:MAG: MFS transporter [Burkholderiales bacterium]|nr:MFS transporter [Burkholderiales bacterium]